MQQFCRIYWGASSFNVFFGWSLLELHYVTVTTSLRHCHYVTVTTSLSLRHCLRRLLLFLDEMLKSQKPKSDLSLSWFLFFVQLMITASALLITSFMENHL